VTTSPAPLSRRAIGGLGYLFLGQGGQLVVQLVTFPILARLVVPEAFGLVAATFVVVNTGALLASVGLSTALIQCREMTDAHVRVAFTIQVAAATIVFGGLALGAGTVAEWLRMPELPDVLRMLALAYFVRGLTLGDAILSRQMRFRPLAGTQLIAYVVGYGVVTVGLAAAGWGVWALTTGHLVASALQTLLLWIVAPHPARPSLHRPVVRELLGTGIGMTICQAGFVAASEADNFVVGRWLGARSLGLYERAYRLMQLPATLFGQALHVVLYPAMASVQGERPRVQDMFGLSTAVLAVLTVPTTVVVWLVTDEIILVVLGSTWLPMRAALDVIVLGMYFKALEAVTDSAIVATGAVYRLARLRLCYAGAILVGAWVGQHWGITGVATGVLLVLTVNTAVLVRLSLRRVGMTWRSFLALHAPAVLLALAAGLAVAPVVTVLRRTGAAPAVVLLAAATTAGVVTLVLVRRAPHWRGATALHLLVARLIALLEGGPGHGLVVRVAGPAFVPTPAPDSEEVPR
jgi:O-antigen/teichoic acid export membrane protein